MEKQEHDIYLLCTCYTLDYLMRQAEAMKFGTELYEKNVAVDILMMIPDLSLDTLNEAISRYNENNFKIIRDDWWVKNDRECDIQTLCTCYPFDTLIERRNNIYNGNAEIFDSKTHGVLYTVEIDVLEEAIACYNEEKYQRNRSEMRKAVWH